MAAMMTAPEPREAILTVLDDGRANTRHLVAETGLTRDLCLETLDELVADGEVRRVTLGLYERA